ncbi:hypothetical protein LTR04_003212 [Oleoguttula sp. CCFEE 6159]|nr:hypothetical protein LTR04_003212 [Oleoguttula sp. CCFEE 6159]
MAFSSLLLLWQLSLAFAVSVTICFLTFLFTLPSAYNPYHPDLIEEDDFTAEDKKKTESGYGYFSKHRATNRTLKTETSVQVVVLGDIGRSPRMQYHALSIAQHGGRVYLVGYQESDVHPDVLANRLISLVPIRPLPTWLRTSSKLLFPIVAPLKALWQAWALYHALGYRTRPTRWMLVQNPPAIPTLLVAHFICFFRNTSLIIDWHNFGSSLLALRLSPTHPLVRLSLHYERFFAKGATAHFAVTAAMARVLKKDYDVQAVTLHDRPSADFQPLTAGSKEQFLQRLPETKEYAQDLKTGAWKLIVSSTSWTADEDISLLLDALVSYSSACNCNPSKRLPKILAIITGKGPLKEHYLFRIRALNQEKKLTSVVILTAWLSTADYASLLGSADLGISLHTSSSGVDLPMKVVDMFGTGLPVLGWSKFEAWPELAKEGVNGRGFGSAEELNDLLIELFGGDRDRLAKLRNGAMEECERRWDDEWLPVAGKTLRLTR